MLLAAFGLANNVVEFIQGTCLGIAGEHLTRALRYQVLAILLRQEVGFFDEDENSVGELSEFLGQKVTVGNGQKVTVGNGR